MNDNIEVSVVMPCLNEEKAVGICIKKIKEIFGREGIRGEIVVADNGSADRSREIASSLGAIVVTEPQKGYGAAYLRGLKEARGKFIVIADSDDTYDFYQIPRFLKPLREGYDFVMGSRFKGEMQKGAMSWSHRYIGNPILSGMCRLFFRTSLSDIHCGMRAFTADAYRKMKLRTLGMEFATEMVLSSLTNNLKVCEVPLDYRPRQGESKLQPLYDAWRHVRFMLLYCPLWLYFVPGVLGLTIGMILLFISLPGPFFFMGRYWYMHGMIFGSMAAIISFQVLTLGVFAHTFAIKQDFLKYDDLTLFFQRHFNLEKGLIIGGLVFSTGFIVMLLILIEWFSKHFGALYRMRESILAMTFMAIGLQTMFSSFFISLLYLERK